MVSKPTFSRYTVLLIFFAVFIQFIIILYNHFSGYYDLEGLNDFLTRWAVGSLLSMIALPFFTFPDIYLVKMLNKFLSWQQHWKLRIPIELVCTTIIAAVSATGITAFANYLSPYPEGLRKVVIINIMIGTVINILLVVILEAWNWYWAKEQFEKEKKTLASELKVMRFEMLKQQINPHFMFNSLNTLSGLVRKDIDLAEQFIEAFADVYRYVMETIERPMVTLEEEFQFTKTYFFLQQIRHSEGLEWSVDLPADRMGWLLPPLSIQMMIENVIKHNAFSQNQPVTIEIFAEGDNVFVKNNIQKKSQVLRSSGKGLQNLKKRYRHISRARPLFTVLDSHFVAKLPLIDKEL